MIEYYIWGVTCNGKVTRVEHGMSTHTPEKIMAAYCESHPNVIRVLMDIAIDAREEKDG